MSQDESLRMVAEVQDKFTGPLGNLKRKMADLAAAGAGHNDVLEKSFGKVTGGIRATEQAVASGLNPALRMVGVTSLTAAGAIAGIGAALRSFGSSAKDLGTLARDTGIASNTLREVQGILGKVGVDAGTSAQAIQQFAEAARLAHRGYGPLVEFLRRQGTSAEGRAYFNGLADSIIRSKDAGDALMKALHGMEGIKDPVERRIYAENVLRMADAARLADGRLGSLRQQIERFRRDNGVLSERDIKDAEDYARALDGLKGTMSKLGDAVARELTPGLSEAARALKSFLDDERNGVQGALVQGIRDIKSELAKIDWAQAGKDSLAFFRETTALAGTLARSLHTAAEALHALEKGDIPEALRQSTGGGGTVGRLVNKYYPRPDASTPTDEALDAQMRGQTVTPEMLRQHQNERAAGGRVPEIEARQAEINRDLGLLDLMQQRGNGSDRSRQQMEDLRREMGRLTEELRRIREGAPGSGGATVQQQSFDGTALGGASAIGALIQKASLGAGGGRGSYGGGGGTLGERLFGHPTGSNALGDPYREKRMQALLNDPSAEWRMRVMRGERNVPLPGSGSYSGSGGPAAAGRMLRGRGDADLGDGIHGRPFGAPKPASGAEQAGEALRRAGRPYRGGLDLRDADPNVVAYIREQAAKRGIDPDTALAVSDGEGLRNFSPSKPVVGDGGTSHGPFQMHYAGGMGRNRQPGLGDDFTRDTGLDARDPSTWRRQVEYSLDHAQKHGWGAWYGRQHHGVGVWDGIGGRAGYAGGGGRQTAGDVPPVDGAGGVDQRQGGAQYRRQAITDELRDQLAAAGRDAGVNAEIYSGGQEESGPGHHGSHRHDHGRSADLKLYTMEGERRRYLSMNNAADRARMEAFIRGTVRYGATGVGSGPGYMGESGIHIGGGTPNAWGAGGSSANAPDWVRRAHRMGMQDRAAGLGQVREAVRPAGDGFTSTGWRKAGEALREKADREVQPAPRAVDVGDGLKQIQPWRKQAEDGGSAFAADFQRRQREEDGRRESLRLGTGAQNAMRSAAGGAQKVEADGRVHINVQTRDPGTRVSHSASGNLFREIIQSRGRQMQPAGDG